MDSDPMFGWVGKILKVDLSREKIIEEPLDGDLAANFLGGRGINVKILYDEVKPGIDPLSPENVLIFGCGPLTGTLSPSSGRFNVTTLSPLTRILGDSNCGGWWAPELKFAGYDHVVIRGRSKKPSYLVICDGQAELRDASSLWGRGTTETQEIIREELGDPETQVVCIGQAGEGLVKFACVRTGLKDSAGRTGTGAVMGSKNLKVIAVRGTGAVRIAKPEEFEKVCIELHAAMREHPLFQVFSTQGSLILSKILHEAGIMPVRNWQTIEFPEIDAISGETFVEKYSVKAKGCFGCPMHCNHFHRIGEGTFAGEMGEGPEYETVNSLGPRCGNSDFPSIIHLGNLCNEYGLDTITLGNVLCLLMELYQRRIVTERDLDGIKLEWGDSEAMIEITEKIVRRQGIGDVLAEGPLSTARKIGKGSERYVVQTKGLDYSSHENRVSKGYALSHAVSTRGGDHLRAIPTCVYWGLAPPRELVEKIFGAAGVPDPRSYERQAVAVIWYEHMYAACDSIGVCKYCTPWLGTAFGLTPGDVVKLFSLATGVNMDEEGMIKASERIYNLERAFIVREGVTREDDYPPRRFLEEPLPSGPTKGERIDKGKYDGMLDEYYELRGWTVEGIPTRTKLEELGLKRVADEMERLGKLHARDYHR